METFKNLKLLSWGVNKNHDGGGKFLCTTAPHCFAKILMKPNIQFKTLDYPKTINYIEIVKN